MRTEVKICVESNQPSNAAFISFWESRVFASSQFVNSTSRIGVRA